MKRKVIFICLLSTFAFLTGCGTFNGNIRFANQSERRIVVDRTIGFSHEPPCGILTPDSHSSASMGRMKFPKQVYIHWWNDGAMQDDATVTTVDLSAIRPPQARYSDLRFTFNKDGSWSVDVMEY